MKTATNSREEMQSPESTETSLGDMAPLIGRLRTLMQQGKGFTSSGQAPLDREALQQQFGFSGRRQGRPEIILSEEVAVELGHPSTASRAVVLCTFDPEIVRQDGISIVGPDLEQMEGNGPHPIGQAVILALQPDAVPDPFEMDNTQYLMNRLPGYMVRSVPGRLWVRISKKARASGLTLMTVGSTLAAAYKEAFKGVVKVEVAFITSGRTHVEELGRIAAEADILAGRHKKLVLGVDGEVECSELNCDTCDEKPVCDNLRDIVIKRRKSN